MDICSKIFFLHIYIYIHNLLSNETVSTTCRKTRRDMFFGKSLHTCNKCEAWSLPTAFGNLCGCIQPLLSYAAAYVFLHDSSYLCFLILRCYV